VHGERAQAYVGDRRVYARRVDARPGRVGSDDRDTRRRRSLDATPCSRRADDDTGTTGHPRCGGAYSGGRFRRAHDARFARVDDAGLGGMRRDDTRISHDDG
jgi:hypothetical protein